MDDWDLDQTIPVVEQNGEPIRATPFVDELNLNDSRPVTMFDSVKQSAEKVGTKIAETIQRDAKIIRWPFWRFIEQPVSTIATALQEPEGNTVGGTLGKAFQGYVPFRKIPIEEYGNYGQIWRNYYKSITQQEPPEWYIALASYGTAMGVETPVIGAVANAIELSATRVATKEEANLIRTMLSPLKAKLEKSGINTAQLHPEGNIISFSENNELFLNKYLSAVFRNGEIRIPKWANPKSDFSVSMIDEVTARVPAVNMNIPDVLPTTGVSVIPPPPPAIVETKNTKTFYRGGGEGSMPNGTAKDVIDYEQTELGNKDIVVEPGIDLNKIPAKDLVWLTETKAQAKQYGEITSQEFKKGEYRIIARDSEGGVLIDRNKLRAEETSTINKQKSEAHIVANEKGFISEKGKPKPQYRKLAEAITGKKSTKDMTPQELDMFINALKKLPDPKIKDGVKIPPSIPKTTNLVTENFFNKTFNKPTPVKLVTSQSRYADLLGVKELTEPFEIAKQKLDLEYAKVANQIDVVVKKLNSLKTISQEEMAKALNTSEEAPEELSDKEKEIFNYFRDLTREIIERENSVRASLGMDLIPYRRSYFRHIADVMAEEVIAGKFAPPEGLKYWSEQVVSKKVYNPMEMQRKLRDELLEHFSKDLPYVMKSMMWTGLKEVYFAQPKYYFNRILGALSKDKSVYPNLTEQEKAVYDAQTTMPASTKRWLIDYVNIVLSGKQTALDESVNLWVTDSPIKDVINGILKPFGKHLSHRPVTNLITAFSKLPIYGVMGGLNPRQLLRNKMQTIQQLALYGVKNTLKGYFSTSANPVLEKLKTDSLFLESYSGFEDMPSELRSKIEKIGLAPYHWTAITNVSQGMNCAFYWTADLIQNPKAKELGWADPQRTYTEDKNFFYPSEKEKILKEMEYGAHTVHYQYIGMGMPEVFRYKSLSGITRLQSWWMNHWFVFHREAATRAFTGHTGYDENLRIRLGDRINYLKYLILGGLILNTLGYERSYLLGTAPTSLPPTAQLCLGLYNYFTNPGDEGYAVQKRSEAERQIKEAAKTFIPGYLAIKDATAFFNGEKDWTEYFFYNKNKKTTVYTR